MIFSRSLAIAAALMVAACGGAAEANQESEQQASAPKLPFLSGRVVDQANLLRASEEAALTQKLADFEARTTNQLVVVTLPGLDGRAIEDWGLWLGNGWGIGQEDKDNGVLIIVAPNERMVRIEVGLGLERTLTDGEAQQIIDEDMLPFFREERMPEGIMAGANAVMRVLDAVTEEAVVR